MTPEGRKRQHWRVRVKAIMALGGCCVTCEHPDVRVLQIDHINGGGSMERKQYRGTSYYYHILKDPDPAKYQVLCANCHTLKTWRSVCVKG